MKIKDKEKLLINKLDQLMFGFMLSQVLFTADELNLFDILNEKEEGLTLSEISSKIDVPEDSIERLLISLIGIGFVILFKEKYCLCQTYAPYLVKKSEKYYGEKFSHYKNVSVNLSRFLKDAIKNNAPQWQKIDKSFNQSYLFNTIYKDEESIRNFLSAMWNLGYTDSCALCDKFSFSGYKHLVDLGGATGSFSIPALVKNSNLCATIFDQPVIEKFFLEQRNLYNLQSRLNFKAGNFFEDTLPAGDVYSLGFILSDWNDEQSLFLLEKIYSSLPTNGMLCILERLFKEDFTGPFLTSMMNLCMLLETYGKHRSFNQYKALLERSNFKNINVIYSGNEKHMIVAYK